MPTWLRTLITALAGRARRHADEDDSVDLIGYSRLGRLDRLPDGASRAAGLRLGGEDPADRLRAAVGSPPSPQELAIMRTLRQRVTLQATVEDQ